MRRSKRILVTGGAGFIGSHLVDYLVGQDHEVIVLDDLSTGSAENLTGAISTNRANLIIGSVLDAEALKVAMQGCDMVYHLAVQCVRRSIGMPIENHHINATGVINTLECAREAGVSKFLYCSSSEIYGNCGDEWLNEITSVPLPTTVYGASKLVGEHYTKAYQETYGMPVTIVRPFNAYGPREHCSGDLAEVIPRFSIKLLNGDPPVIFGDGNQTRDFTFVMDIARGIAEAGMCEEATGKTINIAYGRGRSIKEIASSLAIICGREDIAPIFSEERPGDIIALQADTKMAQEILKFKPNVQFNEGLKIFLEWLNSNFPDLKIFKDDPIRNWISE